MSTPPGPHAQPPAPGGGGYGVTPSQPSYAGGYATAPPPGQAPGASGAYAPPTAGDGHAPDPSGSGPAPAARNPGATIGWVGFGLAFLVGFIGIVLGAISISRSRKAGASTRVGVLAIVVGTLQVLIVIVAVMVNLILQLTGSAMRSNPGDTPAERTVAVTELAPGNCLDLDSLDDTSILQLPCAEPHDSEVISLLSFSGTAYPGEQTLYDDAVDQCYQPVAEAIPPRVDPINLYVDAFVPTQEEWDAGSRQAACLLVSDGEMTGSASAGDLVAPVG
ncbi:septum formation family protein [Salana multivorans]